MAGSRRHLRTPRLPRGGWGFVYRRSVPSLAGLLALLLGVGMIAVLVAHAPLWFPLVLGGALIVTQYAVAPALIETLVPASVIDHDGTRYLTEHPLGDIVARCCRDAGIPLVRLGVVADGNPNAFSFGHTRRDARIWVTQGLLDRLEPDELDAVVAHEVGHVKHGDFVLMTVAACVPIVLYYLWIALNDNSSGEAGLVSLGAYLAYVVSQFVLLSLSRSREYAADHWSCECTGNGDALASALVKIAYGMSEHRAAEKRKADEAREAPPKQLSAAERRQAIVQRRHERLQAAGLRTMGIMDARAAAGLSATDAWGRSTGRTVAAMCWEVANPWATMLEKLQTHPLVTRRIAALEQSGLPGAPRRFAVLRSLADAGPAERTAGRARAGGEALLAAAPVAVAGALLYAVIGGPAAFVGAALAAGGVLLFALQLVRYPTRFVPVPEITALLTRLDASPVRGIPVEVRGTVIGRGFPGYVLSPDLVVQDASGFVPVRYRQPIPLSGPMFAVFRAPDYLGADVVARGWYRRTPGPEIELRSVRRVDADRESRVYGWAAWYALSIAITLAGLVTLAIGLST